MGEPNEAGVSRRRFALGLGGAAALSLSAARAANQKADNPFMLTGPDRRARLVAGARKEGTVVLYTGLIVNQALRPLIAAFQAKYPFINATYWRGDTEEDIVTRVGAELMARRPICDVMEATGIGALAKQARIAQPFETPELAPYPAQYTDPNRLWAPTRLSYYSIAFNTKQVSPEQAPKSYEDLLDPRWAGRMAWRVESESGAPLFLTNLRMAWGEGRAMEYFKKLARQRIVNFASGSARTLVDRVIAGEYQIALNIFAHHPVISAHKGASVASRLLDPTACTTGSICVTRDAPHPNAAMLLVDFFLSEEGQRIFAKQLFFPANPLVPPLPLLASVVPKNAGVHENFIRPDTLLRYNAGSEKIYQTMFR